MGGAGGLTDPFDCNGSPGVLGVGGSYTGTCGTPGGGGAGGGGYYGGGSGAGVTFNVSALSGGGGAGSSYWVPNATNASMSIDNSGVPQEVTITPLFPCFGGCVSIISPPSLPGASKGKHYSTRLLADGGKRPYSWLWVGKFPSGLSLNRLTGTISGTPKTAGRYTFLINVSDSVKPKDSNTETFTIRVR